MTKPKRLNGDIVNMFDDMGKLYLFVDYYKGECIKAEYVLYERNSPDSVAYTVKNDGFYGVPLEEQCKRLSKKKRERFINYILENRERIIKECENWYKENRL